MGVRDLVASHGGEGPVMGTRLPTLAQDKTTHPRSGQDYPPSLRTRLPTLRQPTLVQDKTTHPRSGQDYPPSLRTRLPTLAQGKTTHPKTTHPRSGQDYPPSLRTRLPTLAQDKTTHPRSGQDYPPLLRTRLPTLAQDKTTHPCSGQDYPPSLRTRLPTLAQDKTTHPRSGQDYPPSSLCSTHTHTKKDLVKLLRRLTSHIVVVSPVDLGPVDLHPRITSYPYNTKALVGKGCREDMLGGFVSKTPRLPSTQLHRSVVGEYQHQ